MKGKTRTQESKLLTSLALQGKPQKGIQIINTSTFQKWISAVEAGKYFNVSSNTIHNWIKQNKNNLSYL